jgi:hypothetical protein
MRQTKSQIVAELRRITDQRIADVQVIRDPEYRRLAITYYEAEFELIAATPTKKLAACQRAIEAAVAYNDYDRKYCRRQAERATEAREQHRKLAETQRQLIARSDFPEYDKQELYALITEMFAIYDQPKWRKLADYYSRRLDELLSYDDPDGAAH